MIHLKASSFHSLYWWKRLFKNPYADNTSTTLKWWWTNALMPGMPIWISESWCVFTLACSYVCVYICLFLHWHEVCAMTHDSVGACVDVCVCCAMWFTANSVSFLPEWAPPVQPDELWPFVGLADYCHSGTQTVSHDHLICFIGEL